MIDNKSWIMELNVKNLGVACIMIVAACSNARGQERQRITHILTAGIDRHVIDDALLASGRISTTGFTYSLVNESARRIKTLSVGVETGRSEPDKETAGLQGFTFQYANAFSLWKGRRPRFSNCTGYAVYVDPAYIRSGDQYSWATTASIGLFHSMQYTWQASALRLDLSVPLLAFCSRPEAALSGEGSFTDMLYNSFRYPQLVAAGKLKAVYASLLYEHPVAGSLSVVANALWSYRDLSAGDDFRQQSYSLRAGIAWHIR